MTLTEEDSILIINLYLLKGYGAKKLIKEHFSPLSIHLRVNLVCIKSFYQQGNECCSLRSAFGGDVALFIAYKWRHSDVIIIKLIVFIQNEIPYKTYISDFFVFGKYQNLCRPALGVQFFETQCSTTRYNNELRTLLSSLLNTTSTFLKTRGRYLRITYLLTYLLIAHSLTDNVAIIHWPSSPTKRPITKTRTGRNASCEQTVKAADVGRMGSLCLE